jgi:hypothetical protein
LTALADGRIHLTGACLLAPHLSPANVDDLLEAATHKTKAEIERLVAGALPTARLADDGSGHSSRAVTDELRTCAGAC